MWKKATIECVWKKDQQVEFHMHAYRAAGYSVGDDEILWYVDLILVVCASAYLSAQPGWQWLRALELRVTSLRMQNRVVLEMHAHLSVGSQVPRSGLHIASGRYVYLDTGSFCELPRNNKTLCGVDARVSIKIARHGFTPLGKGLSLVLEHIPRHDLNPPWVGEYIILTCMLYH